jgi:hypothetical protein
MAARSVVSLASPSKVDSIFQIIMNTISGDSVTTLDLNYLHGALMVLCELRDHFSNMNLSIPEDVYSNIKRLTTSSVILGLLFRLRSAGKLDMERIKGSDHFSHLLLENSSNEELFLGLGRENPSIHLSILHILSNREKLELSEHQVSSLVKMFADCEYYHELTYIAEILNNSFILEEMKDSLFSKSGELLQTTEHPNLKAKLICLMAKVLDTEDGVFVHHRYFS